MHPLLPGQLHPHDGFRCWVARDPSRDVAVNHRQVRRHESAERDEDSELNETVPQQADENKKRCQELTII